MPVLLDDSLYFPDPRKTSDPDGLVAVGADLSPERLIQAYRHGIFPWTEDPITWWSPDPRGILEWDQLHISRSLRTVLNKDLFEITLDQDFRSVIRACALIPRPGSWIGPGFINAYTALHQMGLAHSIECYQEGILVGGIYGIAIGGLFAGESMFHTVSNASKVALVHLVRHLQAQGFLLFDLQMLTPITEAMGAIQISRAAYIKRLEAAVAKTCHFLPCPPE